MLSNKSISIISNPDPLLFLNSVTEDLNKLKLWFNTNLLFLNFSKTEFMKFNIKMHMIMI
jgi:hypothetical protein